VRTWTVTCKINGEASCTVEAETYDDAIRLAKEEGEWVNTEWDCNWSEYNGSIDASEDE